MEKENHQGHDFIRPLFGFGNYAEYFFRKFSSAKSASYFRSLTKIRNNSLGLTLIELVVVVAMLLVLSSLLLGILDPIGQIHKAQDAQREHDLTQVNASLDAYFNDNNCYPTSLIFGSSWSQGGNIYMSKVPEDPACSGGNNCYVYLTDKNSSCPQWNVILAKVSSTTGPKISCILGQSCFPTGYVNLGYNYCVVSGKPDCSILSQISPSGPGGTTPIIQPPTSSPTPGGGGTPPTASPTLSPTPEQCQIKNWDCRPGGCNNVCNPSDPKFPNCNNGQYCDGTCGGHC